MAPRFTMAPRFETFDCEPNVTRPINDIRSPDWPSLPAVSAENSL